MSKNDQDIVQIAQELFEKDKAAWSHVYQSAREDLFFLSDDPQAQWDASMWADRFSTGRPTLTIDQLTQFCHQVVNDIRMNTPSINIIPAGGGADVETAEIIKGKIRNIEYRSNADEVYDTAANFSVKSSLGWIRVDHDFADDEGFVQELKIKRVVNNLSCYIDSDSIECDGRDAMHGFVLETMPVAAFNKRWPDRDPVSFAENTEASRKMNAEDTVTVCEFFRIVETGKQIAVGEDGEEAEYEEGMDYRIKRTVTKRTVERFWLSGKDVLEQTTFPGKYVPLVPVYGEEAWREGKRYVNSLIRKSKGAQQMYNLWKSLETELLMKQPQAPVMAAEGSIEDYAADWKNPSKSMALRYRTTDAKGNPIPPPQRLDPPTIPTGIVNASRETVDDIKATMGMYNASIGQRSNETSGRAIAARQQEGDVATYHFADNLTRSVTQVGRILVCALPEIHDTAREEHILGVEDTPEVVGVNGARVEGQERDYDLTKGKYDVRVTTGPSFTTARQEAVTALTEVFKAQPQLMQVMGDLYFKNSDFSGSQEMAERMKKIMPPNITGEDEAAPDPEKQQMAAELEQAKAALMQIGQENQAMKADKTGEAEKNQLELYKIQQETELKKLDYALELKKIELEYAKLQQAERQSAVQAEISLKKVNDAANQGASDGGYTS